MGNGTKRVNLIESVFTVPINILKDEVIYMFLTFA